MPTFRVPSPCPVPWETMTATEGGRFCARCAKVVLDLTDCTEAEALARTAALPAGERCGRFLVRDGRAVFRAAAAAACVTGAPALADDPVAPDPNPHVLYRDRTEIDFEGVDVQGVLVQPSGGLFLVLHDEPRMSPMLRVPAFERAIVPPHGVPIDEVDLEPDP